MARPKKTISRPYRITVRFTDMEYGLITDAAEETGVTLSEYIRKMVLEGKIAIRYEVVADIPELQKLTAEFGKIGSNLNQIARYFIQAASDLKPCRMKFNPVSLNFGI